MEVSQKWRTFLGMFCGYVVYTLCRRTFTYSQPSLMEDLGLAKSDLGIISSAWSAAYGISKFGYGVTSDAFSPCWCYALGLAMSGLACISFSLVSNLALLATIWFVNGMFQGLGWPAIAVLVTNWCQSTELASWWSALSAAGNIGLALSPFLITFLVSSLGWRVTFFAIGCACVCVSLVLPFVIHDEPAQPVSGDRKTKKPKASAGKILELLQNKVVVLLSVCYFLVSLSKEGWSTWGLLYLMEQKGQTSTMSGSVMFVFEAGGICGSMATGVLSDLLLKWNKSSEKAIDRLPLCTLLGVWTMSAFGMLHFLATGHHLTLLYVCAFSIGFSTYGIICLLGVMACEVVPRHMAGASNAIISLVGQTGGFSSGYPIGWVMSRYTWTGAAYVWILAAGAIPGLLSIAYMSFKMTRRPRAQHED